MPKKITQTENTLAEYEQSFLQFIKGAGREKHIEDVLGCLWSCEEEITLTTQQKEMVKEYCNSLLQLSELNSMTIPPSSIEIKHNELLQRIGQDPIVSKTIRELIPKTSYDLRIQQELFNSTPLLEVIEEGNNDMEFARTQTSSISLSFSARHQSERNMEVTPPVSLSRGGYNNEVLKSYINLVNNTFKENARLKSITSELSDMLSTTPYEYLWKKELPSGIDHIIARSYDLNELSDKFEDDDYFLFKGTGTKEFCDLAIIKAKSPQLKEILNRLKLELNKAQGLSQSTGYGKPTLYRKGRGGI